MIIKRLISKIMILVLFVITFTITYDVAYGYFDWLQVNEQVTFQIGAWVEEIADYNENITYLEGDRVIYNGQEYIALKDVPTGKYPDGFGYSKNFWSLVP